MGVPKRRTSKCRIRARKHAHMSQRMTVAASKPCPQCGAAHLPHRVCKACGYYNGRQVVTVQAE